jgi:hypothetical protein
MRRVTSLCLLLLAVGACRKEAKLPAPQQLCQQVERGSDRAVAIVPCAGKDTDGDGVDDAVDLCPGLLETDNGLFDKDGCPDPDRDLDGFLDYEDACPDEPGGPPDGCPFLDSDGDGIPDHLDACPHRPEDLDGVEDDDGCPEGMIVRVQARALDQQLWQRARIDALRGKATATKEASVTLDELAEAVATRPGEVARVRLVGYASAREAHRGRAKELAKERVRLVEQRLRQSGVEAARFERAIYPVKDKSEGEGRVDVMVFLDLKAALDTEARQVSQEPVATDAGPPTPPSERPAPSDAGAAPVGDEWDVAVVKPFEEPAMDPQEEDWDLLGR